MTDAFFPLFKCDPVLCSHEPPATPIDGCGVILPINIHDASNCGNVFPVERTIENQPNAEHEVQYETMINYTCPGPQVKQSQVDYLKNNFTFEFDGANTPSTYIQTLQAYCEIDK